MNSLPLRVLVVSRDRSLLRQVSRFLNMFGYRVQQAAEMEHARAALQGEPPHVMILDAAENEEAIHWLSEQSPDAGSSAHVHTLVLLGRPTPRGIVDAVAAGADDFLESPIVFGELLARLRAAGRSIELERRVRQQEGVDPLTGLPNREKFLQLLRRRSQGKGPHACAVADLDLVGRVNRRYGMATGDETIRATAEVLRAAFGDGVALASFGGGRFAAFLADSSLEAAKSRAERAREAVAELGSPGQDENIRITASFGVAAGSGGEMVSRAEEALQAAKHSGRDCVVCHGQFDDEDQAWVELTEPGKLFERTEAHHVMSPVPVMLRVDDTAADAVTLLQSTRLDALIVINSDGRLAGVVAVDSDLTESNARLSEVVETDVATFNEDASLAALLDFFTREDESWAVITHDGRPTGLITRDQLATLCQAVAVDRFLPDGPCSNNSNYLVVTDRVLAGNAL